ncbi:hypothetical protein GCM10025776_17150 [Corallincola platygyrae]
MLFSPRNVFTPFNKVKRQGLVASLSRLVLLAVGILLLPIVLILSVVSFLIVKLFVVAHLNNLRKRYQEQSVHRDSEHQQERYTQGRTFEHEPG